MTPFIRLRDKANEGGISVKKDLFRLFSSLQYCWRCQHTLPLPALSRACLPAISFDGTTANCRVSVSVNHGTDCVEADIALWDGSTCIADWDASGTGYLLFSNSAQVTKGRTYELTVDVTINGVNYQRVSIEGTCK